MRLLFALLLWLALLPAPFAQAPYFQQEVNYRIEVQLDDSLHTLDGHIAFEYVNRSPDALTEIWIHLWPNAYKNTRTAFCRQKLRNKNVKFYFAPEEKRGYIYDLAFSADNKPLRWEYHPEHPDIARVSLPAPLAPDNKITISTPFKVKIPASFSRLGHVGQSYQITQWYPKPAVYDRKGWHQMPYLDAGEFFSEFGRFEVAITLPANYVVGATGVLLDESERLFLQKKETETRELLLQKNVNNPDDPFPPSDPALKTLRFTADSVHDFAWFADKRFLVLSDTARLANQKIVPCMAMFTRSQAELWREGAFYVKRAVEFYSQHVGPYPWPHATAVHSALSAGGGMEYPMITVIGESSSAESLDEVITHEVGHNWFYGILATSERDHAWMDEGLNTYYEFRYMDTYYPGQSGLMGLPEDIFSKKNSGNIARMAALIIARERRLPPDTHADLFGEATYGIQSYMKPAVCLRWLEKSVDTARFDAAMQRYFSVWRMRHPYPEDLLNAWKEAGMSADWFLDAMRTTKQADYALQKVRARDAGGEWDLRVRRRGALMAPVLIQALKNKQIVASEWYQPPSEARTFDVVFPPVDADAFVIDAEGAMMDFYPAGNHRRVGGWFPGLRPLKVKAFAPVARLRENTLGLLPWIGWNDYDKFMLGALFYNPPLPSPRFQYYIAPGVGWGSTAPVGLADLRYSVYPESAIQRITLGLSAKSFHYAYNKEFDFRRRFTRISPQAELSWRSASSSRIQHSRYRAIYLSRDFAVFEDAAFQGLEARGQWIHELSHQMADEARPNPYFVQVAIEGQAYRDLFDAPQSYLRLSTEWRQHFYYGPKRKITARGFVGYFLHNTCRNAGAVSNDLARSSFALNPQGFNDYRFDQIFLGRSADDGFLSRQVSQTEGGFKNAFGAAYAGVVGNSNNFIAALNLKADLPRRLPWGIPLKPWFDIGYFDDATPLGQGRPLREQLLWSGGLMLELADGACEVYFPLVNSPALRDVHRAYGGDNYWRRISWSFRLNRNRPIDVLENMIR